ncbi:hypothetical protein AKO1_013114 [Acrasis kona]|uniref:C2H2-type domain-containing protein n=1 Tax=Acrasis kona TaxID=1008807 RepID=A0AAW2ZJP5_9EUKA
MSKNLSQRATLSDVSNKENLAPIQTNILKRSMPFKMNPYSPKEKKRIQEKFFCRTCSQQFQNRSKAEHHARKYFGIPWTKPVSELTIDEKMKLTSTVGTTDSLVTPSSPTLIIDQTPKDLPISPLQHNKTELKFFDESPTQTKTQKNSMLFE